MDYKYKISLIMPCYNSENFLAETLDNLLAQTLKDIQIIIVNDGSKDRTAEIIADYASRHSNILSVYQENAGVSAARNNGMGYIEGKYTMFADSDDLMSSDALEVLYNALEKSEADVAICRAEYFGYGGNHPHPEAVSLSQIENIDVYNKLILWNFLVSNKCYKSSFLKESGVTFPLKRYAEDGAFCLQIFYRGAKIIGVKDAVMYYRRHEPKDGFSVTQSINYNLVEDMFDCIGIIAQAAQKSFERPDCTCQDKEGYLQELYCRTYSAFVNSFYRLIWSADDKTIALMKARFEDLVTKIKPESRPRIAHVDKDLNGIEFSKEKIAQNPYISVIAEKPTEAFVHSLYAQSMPHFELITTCAPVRENVVILPQKSFAKAAKKAAKGKVILRYSGKNPVKDVRIFKVISLLKRNKLFGRFPLFAIKIGAKVFLKFKK